VQVIYVYTCGPFPVLLIDVETAYVISKNITVNINNTSNNVLLLPVNKVIIIT